jgi:tetratricopeptide (TPR) repeat protein
MSAGLTTGAGARVGRAPTDADQAAIAAITAMAPADPARAEAMARQTFPDGLDHPMILYLLAQRPLAAGRFPEALEPLRRAAELAPGDAEVLNDLGHCLFSLGDTQSALRAFEAALAIAPDKLAALCNKAAALVAAGDRPAGTALFERARELHPNAPAPLTALARLAAKSGDAAAARANAIASLRLDGAQTAAAFALAEADVLDRDFVAAERRLTALLNDPRLPPDLRAPATTLLGDALDGQDRTAEAFAAYQRAARSSAPSASHGEGATALAARLERYFSGAPAAAWRRSPGPDTLGAGLVRQHVFLVGFPRSGTTLLEQALASHPDVVSLEETAALADVSARWPVDADLDRLAGLTAGEAAESRAAYWRFVQDNADLGDGQKTLVDKSPLHTVRLPLIAKLFPDAKILFALRDPRDVVFSCFRRRIAMATPLNEFAAPETAAAYYAQVMRLAVLYGELLALPTHVVRHEAMVEDFQGQLNAALAFMGLGWNPAVERYAERAAARSKTPSAAQVARGVNAEGVGQWRRYAAQLAPILGVLDPWVERFGYGVEAPPAPDPGGARLAERLGAAQQAIGRGDWASAFGVATGALDEGLQHLLFYKLRALSHEQHGRPDQAIADFERVLAEAPGDFAALNALGLCLAKSGRPAEGLVRLDAAIALQPRYAAAHYNRGWTLESSGDLVGARQAYERAAELEPAHLQALAGLASLAGRAADWPRAEALAARVLAADPGHPTAAITLAQAALAQGRADQAASLARAVLDDPRRATPHDRSLALTVLGDGLDRQDRPAEAFAAYAQANAGLRDSNAARFAAPGVETGLARARRLAEEFAAIPAAAWREPPPGPASPVARHVFVLGFPRSGTTFLGQVLQSHPEVVTLDEQETLADASLRFIAEPGGLARLAASDEGELAPLREAYWRRARAAGAEPAGKVFVDKLPMNTIGLPLIARMFPAAKVIFVRRDPRDVVLSAFRRQFVVNAATWELLTLEGAARFYDAVMRLFELYRAGLALDLRVQSHEALVADFDAESRALAAFLGLDWSEARADIAGPSRQGRIATPSAGQITGGLSGEGVGQWRRYAAQLAPALPILRPWAELFGYEAD